MDIIILRFQKKIILIDEYFIQNIVTRLIYLGNINFVYHKSVKKNINISNMNIIANPKQLRLDIKSTKKFKPIIKFILISILKLNIITTLNNAINLNKTTVITRSSFLDEIFDIY